MTGFASVLSAITDRLIAGHEAAAERNEAGAVGDNGVPVADWLIFYASQARALRKLALDRAASAEALAKDIMPAVADCRRAPYAGERLEKRFGGGDLAKAAGDLKKSGDALAKMATEILVDGQACSALVARLDAWLSEPTLIPGDRGAPAHLVGRAIPGSLH